MSMRLKLFLAFSLIILITVTSVVLILRQNAVDEVRQYIFRGGMMGLNGMVVNLEQCYQEAQTWEPCTPLLEHGGPAGNMPRGMNGGRMGGGPPPVMGSMDVQLLNDQGRILADTGEDPDPAGTRVTSLEGAIPLRSRNQVVGYLLPDTPFVFSQQNETQLVQRLNRAALTAALISGITALLLAFLLGSQLIKPVQSLTAAAEGIKHGDLSRRVDIQGSGELAALGQVFNQMAHSIEGTAERRKALTADIAHELRTPLSVQQAHLEALEDGIYPLTIENLRPILEQNQNLVRLVDDLRTLSLADSGELTLERTRTDLVQLTAKVVDRYRLKSREKDVRITFSSPDEPLVARVDPQRVEQIAVNLLSNALRHSPPGERIEVKLEVQDDQLVLTIRDRGEGIPEDELPLIFERFYKSKISRDQDKAGTGLGLSISQKLAQAHGGSIRASNHPDRGAVFQFQLPLDG
jgi:signal transduction histidine kinase